MKNKLLTGLTVAMVTIGLLYFISNVTSTPKTEEITKPSVKTHGSEPHTLVPANNSTYKVKKYEVSEENIVVLNTEIFYESVNTTIDQLDEVLDNNDFAYLVIDSPGGSVLDGARLISYIEASSKPIFTVCEGLCASMGFQIFEVGKKRLMVDRAILMAHPASGGAMGQIKNMLSMLQMIDNYVDKLDMAVANRAGIEFKDFQNRVAFEYWLDAQDSTNVKLADEVVALKRTSSPFKNKKPSVKDILRHKKINTSPYNITVGKGYIIDINERNAPNGDITPLTTVAR